MHIRYHTSNVSSRVRFAVGREFNRFEVADDWWVKVHRVTLVERVDLASGGDLDFGVGKDEFSKRLFISTWTGEIKV
jgi:hypothetical protein